VRRLKKMEVRHYSATLDRSVKKFIRAMEKRVDVDQYQDILFNSSWGCRTGFF
jgi:hypothetical protein